MADYNCVVLLGRITRDPELKYAPNGAPVCSFSVAINHQYTKSDGQIRAIGPAAADLLVNVPGSKDCPYVFPADVGEGHFTAAKSCLARLCATALHSRSDRLSRWRAACSMVRANTSVKPPGFNTRTSFDPDFAILRP